MATYGERSALYGAGRRSVPVVALDTNCVEPLFDTHGEQLRRWHEQSVIRLVACFRMDVELERWSGDRAEQLRERLRALAPPIGELLEPGTYGRSVYGHAYYATQGTPSDGEIASVIFGSRRISEADLNDVTHVCTAIDLQVDVFVTQDGKILTAAQALHARWGLEVRCLRDSIRVLSSEAPVPSVCTRACASF